MEEHHQQLSKQAPRNESTNTYGKGKVAVRVENVPRYVALGLDSKHALLGVACPVLLRHLLKLERLKEKLKIPKAHSILKAGIILFF